MTEEIHMPYQRTLRPWIVLLFAVLLAVFPYGWIGLEWAPFGHWLDTRFSTEMRHHAVHVAIYTSLGALLLLLFNPLKRQYFRFAAIVVVVGAMQECLQLTYKNRLVAWNDGKDVLVDIAAATSVFLLVAIWELGKEADSFTKTTNPPPTGKPS